MNDSSCVFEIIFDTLQQSYNTMSVRILCQMAGVSRSGYYAWVKSAPTRNLREQQDRDDFDLILAACKMHGHCPGCLYQADTVVRAQSITGSEFRLKNHQQTGKKS